MTEMTVARNTLCDAVSKYLGQPLREVLTVINPSALDLSRIQFAFTISFHIIFSALGIGLASFLAVLEAAWLRTGKLYYQDLCIYWSKIFAVRFAMGVVSGVVMVISLERTGLPSPSLRDP
jgi:hypothetical protein